MAAIITSGFGPGASISLVVLEGFVPGAPAVAEESLSTAGLRAHMALELPGFLGAARAIDVAADLAAFVSTVAELGETAVLAGQTVNVIGVTPFVALTVGGAPVEARITRIYVAAADFDDIGAGLGSAVTFRSVSYLVSRVERMDGGLVRVELQR